MARDSAQDCDHERIKRPSSSRSSERCSLTSGRGKGNVGGDTTLRTCAAAPAIGLVLKTSGTDDGTISEENTDCKVYTR